MKETDELIPPTDRISFIGGGDYKRIGEEFFNYFKEIGGLKSDDKVLDVGCGIGRMAIPLTKFLRANGSYEGFDIVPDGIDWCTDNITSKYPNFKFHLFDVQNSTYNVEGKQKAAEYRFPFSNKSFDFIFLTSVFTHMLPGDMENYLSEISRVLKPGGKLFTTYFLLNEESIQHIKLGQSTLDFKYNYKNHSLLHASKPEDAIAFDEKFIVNILEKENLEISKPIYFGSWCGRSQYLSYQDILLSVKIE